MPNWVNNSVGITFDNKERYEKLKLKYEASNEFFNTICPRPKEFDEGWYAWNMSNWGTKWEEKDCELTFDDENYVISGIFNTAWGPPIEVYKLLVLNWDADVEANYYEPGMEFCGLFINTKIGVDINISYDFKEFKEYVDDIGANNLNEYEKELFEIVECMIIDEDEDKDKDKDD